VGFLLVKISVAFSVVLPYTIVVVNFNTQEK
jgi:hypothetical protein